MFDIEKIKNTIIAGDCVENLKKIPSESVDLIFADPPYFMQTEGQLRRTDGTAFKGVDDAWDKFADYQAYDAFTEQWLKECKRILKKNGSIWVIGAFQNIYRLGYLMQNMGFWILNDVIWSKTNPAPNFAGTRFQNAHETLLWCTKDSHAKYTFNYKTMKHLNGGKQARSVWNIGLCIGAERLKDSQGVKVHSTQKPEKLLYNIIIASSKPNDLVLDPFFGTGTTGAVAKQTGRHYIGLEKEENYIKVAQARIDRVQVMRDEITDLALEVKPPRVPMSLLIKEGYLQKGQALYTKQQQKVGLVVDNGYIDDGHDVLSIHKMAAKQQGLPASNGWGYFWVIGDQGDFIPLDSLRYRYQKEKK